MEDLRLFYGTYPGDDLSAPQAFPTAPDYEKKRSSTRIFSSFD